MDKAKIREAVWSDMQRRESAGKTLFLGDTRWLYSEVGTLREELAYWKACAAQNNRETNEQRTEVKRLTAENETLHSHFQDECGECDVVLARDMYKVALQTADRRIRDIAARSGGPAWTEAKNFLRADINLSSMTASARPSEVVLAPEDEVGCDWVVHVLGPDDVIPCASQFEALRNANVINRDFAEAVAKDPSPNWPHCWAVVKNRAVETV